MKISELIKELQSILDKEGDLDVRQSNYDHSYDFSILSVMYPPKHLLG